MSDDDALKELLGSQIDSVRAEFTARMDAMQLAVNKAERINDIRLENVNEWRGSMNDLQSRLASQERVENLEERIRGLEAYRSYLLGGAAIIAILVSVLLKIFG